MFTGIRLDIVKSYYTVLAMMVARGIAQTLYKRWEDPDTASMPPFSMPDGNIKTFYEHNTKTLHNAASDEAVVFGWR